jgi:hypothetical protein
MEILRVTISLNIKNTKILIEHLMILNFIFLSKDYYIKQLQKISVFFVLMKHIQLKHVVIVVKIINHIVQKYTTVPIVMYILAEI